MRTGLKFNRNDLTLFLAISISLTCISCGLPDYALLEPPTIVSYTRNSVAFRAADDSNNSINGYYIYYKIYDYNDSSISNEADQFDPAYYDNSSLSSLPNGSTLPVRLGFSKMGYVGSTSNSGYQVIHGSSSDIIEINFENSINQDSGTDPVIFLNGSDMNGTYGIPARGIKYNEADFGGYTGNNTFKRFVKNYEYENTYGKSYVDGDIEELIDGNPSPTNIQIAFAVYSYSYDFSAFEELTSIPVYLGTVDQNNFSDNATDIPITN